MQDWDADADLIAPLNNELRGILRFDLPPSDPGFCLLGAEHFPHGVDFIHVHGMTHAGIGPEIYFSPQFLEYPGSILDQVVAYPGIAVAAADEHRGSLQGARVVARRSRWSDQSPAVDK